MEKIILIVLLALMAGVVFIEGALAQGTFPPGVFSGTITKVDPERKGFVVQNQDGEMFFQWGRQTRVNGSPLGGGGLISNNLKEGMQVTILYTEVERNRVASKIAVQGSSLGTLKGWNLPFGCGMSVC